MSKQNKINPSPEIKRIQARLKKAFSTKDEAKACLELSELGLAFFQNRQYQEGLDTFAEALETAVRLDRLDLQVHCLGRKALAYQEARRLADAFTTCAQIIALAEKHQDPGLKCDALAHQGQIQLDSGEPRLALEKLREARKIANDTGDERRLMNVFGMLGSYSLAVVSFDQAEAYYEKALTLARKIGDLRAEIGYLGNLGSVQIWLEKPAQAEPLFQEVLRLGQQEADPSVESNALYYLTEVYSQLENYPQALSTGRQGLEIARVEDPNLALSFLNQLMNASFHSNRIEEGIEYATSALDLARAKQDKQLEIELNISLGEANLVLSRYEQALEAYRGALADARKLERLKDTAYLTGRIGYVLADMGQPEQALAYHRQSIDLAAQEDLAELKGEQLSLLAMAYLDLQSNDLAAENCQASIAVFSEAGLKEEAEKARQLLINIHQAAGV